MGGEHLHLHVALPQACVQRAHAGTRVAMHTPLYLAWQMSLYLPWLMALYLLWQMLLMEEIAKADIQYSDAIAEAPDGFEGHPPALMEMMKALLVALPTQR